MPDTLPPNGGPSPFDGWDLKGLLSDENVWVSESMRPVAGTLAALRSAPMRAELAGEAAARAMFRQVMVAREGGRALSGGETGDAPTLILPTPGAAGGRRLVRPSRRSHRRPPRRGRWQSKALVGAAAAAVVIVGVAVVGAFSGAGGPVGLLAHSLHVTSARTQSAGNGPGSNGPDAGATKQTVGRPAHGVAGSQRSSGAESGPDALCRQYWAFYAHPESSASQQAENANLKQLSGLAGGLSNVNHYCTPYGPGPAGSSAPGSNPGGPNLPVSGSTQAPSAQHGSGGSGSDGTGSSGTGSGGSGTGSNGNGAGSGGSGAGSGSGGNGNGGNGKGQGGNSAGGLQ